MAGILDGKAALITGAGSGIGRATSRIFARDDTLNLDQERPTVILTTKLANEIHLYLDTLIE